MPTETFSNFARTTVQTTFAASGVATITLADGSLFPTGYHLIAIENEIIAIASRAGNVLTISGGDAGRAQKGTVAAIHASGALALHGPLAHHVGDSVAHYADITVHSSGRELGYAEKTISHSSGANNSEFNVSELNLSLTGQVRPIRVHLHVPKVGTNNATGGTVIAHIRKGLTSTSRTVADGVTTANSTTLTSATAAFVAGDVGTYISGGSIPPMTKIASRTSGTSVVLSAPATASATAVSLTIGSPVIGQSQFYMSTNNSTGALNAYKRLGVSDYVAGAAFDLSAWFITADAHQFSLFGDPTFPMFMTATEI